MSNTVSAIVTITNKLGLHARPAMVFVETASRFDSDISVKRVDNTEVVDGKSIMQLMMLAATAGTEIEVTANGEDAQQAVGALQGLVDSKFDEE